MSRLTVIRSDRSSQPFMRGILTNELMRRGMSFPKAFKIAEDIKSHFQGKVKVTTRNLAKKIEDLIEKRYGAKELALLLLPERQVGEIRVFHRKSSAPFSKVMLAQSLTAGGLDQENATRISFEIEKQLFEEGTLKIQKSELYRRIGHLLEKKYDTYTADLYRLASRMDELDRPVIIYILGAPGTGKSVLSTSLSNRLGINKVISTDSIREIMRLAFSGDLLPTLFQSTTEAWQGLPLNFQSPEQLITGFCLQSDQVSLGVRAVVERTLEEGVSMIVEGVHLLPYMHQVVSGKAADAYHIPLSLTVLDKKQHQNRFSERGSRNTRKKEKFYLERFEEIRAINDYTLAQCETEEIEILNNEDFDETLNTLVQYIIQRLQQQVSNSVSK